MRAGPGRIDGLRAAVTGRLDTGFEGAARGGLDQLVRRNLRTVRVRGVLPVGPCVWAANHHSWWDFFVAAAALRAAGRQDIGVLMDADNLGRRSLFEKVGVVGTDRLRSAVDLLRAGSVLVVFPEGELRPAGPIGPLHPGARWLADRSGAELRAVATRVVLRGQQAPEAYLDVTAALGPDDDLAVILDTAVTDLDLALASSDPMQPLPGFRQTVSGVRSWQERVGALRSDR